MAFNVGFSPVSLGRSGRLTRQKGFIQKQPAASGQVSSLINMFESRTTPNSSANLSCSRGKSSAFVVNKIQKIDTDDEIPFGTKTPSSSPSVNAGDSLTAGSLMDLRSCTAPAVSLGRSSSVPVCLCDTTVPVAFTPEVLPVRQSNHLSNNSRKRKLQFSAAKPETLASDKYKNGNSKSVVLSEHKDLGIPGVIARKELNPLSCPREENIYDEIGDVPYMIQSTSDVPSMSTPNPGIRLESSNAVPEGMLNSAGRTDVFIRHLNSSPDFLRLSSRTARIGSAGRTRKAKTPVKPVFRGNAWIEESKPELSFTESADVVRRPKLPLSVSSHRINPVGSPYLGPSLAFGDKAGETTSSSSKPPAGNTPRKLIGSLISRMKRTPKKMKLSSLKLPDDNAQF